MLSLVARRMARTAVIRDRKGRFVNGNPYRIGSYPSLFVPGKTVAVMPSGLTAEWHRFDCKGR